MALIMSLEKPVVSKLAAMKPTVGAGVGLEDGLPLGAMEGLPVGFIPSEGYADGCDVGCDEG